MLVRGQAVAQVGGMDERFFLYFEDTDWCRRMWSAGWKVVYLPLPLVVHTVGSSSCGMALIPLWKFHQSCYRYLAKYDLRERPFILALAALALCIRFFVVSVGRFLSRMRVGG